ncbi:MAG: hypothetical protein HC896_10430 [Bacteroidales bacterium]|nr:hypothetical protein [Bacteroidales bacterium]
MHVTTCYKELIEVFNPRNRPWINMHGAPTEKIIEIVEKCPTDALTWKWNKDVDPEIARRIKEKPVEKVAVPTVKIMKDGPVVIRGGEFKVHSESDGPIKTMKITSLCRCGESANMPFCDGTHRKIGFTDDQ